MAIVKLIALWLWCLPTTLVGLLVSCVYHPGGLRWRNGVLEMRVVWLPMKATGQTIGRLIMFREPFDGAEYQRVQPHEMVHVRQNEQWGILWGPAYGIACLIAMAKGGHFYRDNYFEKQARELAGY